MFIRTNTKVYKIADYLEISAKGHELVIVTTDRPEPLRIPFASAENARKVLQLFLDDPSATNVQALEGEWQHMNPKTGQKFTENIYICAGGPVYF